MLSKFAIPACIITFTVFLCLLTFDAHRLIVHLDIETTGVYSRLDRSMDNIDDVTRKVSDASDAQIKYWNNNAKETGKTMHALRLVIDRTDQSINDHIAPQIVTTIENSSNLTAAAADNVRDLAVSLRPVVAGINRAITAAADDVANPSIVESEDSIAAATAQLNGVAADAHTESTLLVGKTQDALKPKNKFLALSRALLGGSVSFVELYYYLSH